MPVWVFYKNEDNTHNRVYYRLVEVNGFYIEYDRNIYDEYGRKWKLKAYGPPLDKDEAYVLAYFSSLEAAERELVSIASAINSGFNVIRVKGFSPKEE